VREVRLLTIGRVLLALTGSVLAYQAWARRTAESSPALSEFDPSTAQASTRHAAVVALANCEQLSGPDGPGRVELQFEPPGFASHVQVFPDALSASARGACIANMFRVEAAVPAFLGETRSVSQALHAQPPRAEGTASPRLVAAIARDPQRFDASAAGLALARAARQVTQQCRRLPGGPAGDGKVLVEFANDGRAKDVQLLAAQFQGAPSGECASKVFSTVRVPAFAGGSARVVKTFFIGDGSGPAPAFDYEAAAQALADGPPPFDPAKAEPVLRDAAQRASECHLGDAWGSGEIQVEFNNYGRVDHAQLLGERFEGTATGECVANAFRAASVPVFRGPSSGFIQGFEVEPSSSLDEATAAKALADAAQLAAACKPKSGPTGQLEVGVRFSPDGSVQLALVVTAEFRGSITAKCVEMWSRRIRVAPFDGPAPPLFQRVVIE
jgi:hypothetical protein